MTEALETVAGAIPYKNTDVKDGTWDAGANTGNIKDGDEAALRAAHAWVDSNGDPKARSSYKLPHHFVASDGTVGAASKSGVDAAIARVNQANTDIPQADKGAVMSHLKKHQDAYNAAKKSGADDLAELRMAGELVVVAGRVWAMRPEALQALNDRFAGRSVMGAVDIEAIGKRASVPKVQGNGVAVVPISGMIAPKLTLMSWLMGADAGLDEILGGIKAAVADPDVQAVVLDVDSPGGMVDGVPEAAAQIRTLAQTSGKPIVAVANTLIASAAYWLASQAHEVIASPSSEVGSVGVYQLHKDASGMFDQMGIKHTLIKAGAHKTEGNPFEPLDSEALAAAQQAVNDYYGMFVGDVALGRTTPTDDATPDPEEVTDGTAFGAGRTFTAKRAVKAGLADRVATLPETISRLSSGRAKIRRTADDDGPPISAEDPGLHTESEPQPMSETDRHRLFTVLAELGVHPT